MKPECLADPESRGACGVKDMTVALHQLPLLTGMGQHHCVCCVYPCPALLCSAPGLQQDLPTE